RPYTVVLDAVRQSVAARLPRHIPCARVKAARASNGRSGPHVSNETPAEHGQNDEVAENIRYGLGTDADGDHAHADQHARSRKRLASQTDQARMHGPGTARNRLGARW